MTIEINKRPVCGPPSPPAYRRWLVLVALGMLAHGTATADPRTRPMHFEHITLQQGLSQSSVMSILQDSQGFVWLGTENGLNRYDGYSIHTYNRDRSSPNALRSDFVWAIAEDRAGNLWLATEGGGVARWNRSSDTFKSFLNDPDDPKTLSSNSIRTLAIGADQRIWIGTRDSGLNALDQLTGDVTRFRHDVADELSLSSDSIFAIHVDRSGQLWVGTDAGLNRFDRDGGGFVRYRHQPDNPQSLSDDTVLSIFEDGDGVLWVGTFNGGLNRFDRASGRFTRFQHDAANPNSLSDDHVRSIFEGEQGRLWVGTADGLDLMDRSSGEFTHYRHDPANSQSLRDSYIMALYKDRSGILWVGTRAAGASKWNPRSWSLGHYKDKWLQDANVTSFADDGVGNLWVGTFGAGLGRLNPELTTIERYGADGAPGKAALSDDNVMSLLLDHDGFLWIGTMTGGLNRLNPATGTLEIFRHDPDDPSSLSADGVMTLYQASTGDIWVGTFGGGVTRLNYRTGELRRYLHDPADPTSISNARATAIVEDFNGRIWIATDGGGLNLLEPDSGTFLHYRHAPHDPRSLSSDSIYALHVDNTGMLWVGTAGGGLDRLVGSSNDPSRIQFENISKARGLPSNVIYGIHSDHEGNLWLSSNNGLTRLDPTTGRLKTFHANHGLQGEEFDFGSHHQSPDGKLYFGGANGFNAFYPSRLEESTHAPAVVLTSFEKFNRPTAARPNTLMSGIELSHQDDVITFEFAALDFTSPEQNRYAYFLEGFDNSWNDAVSLRRATYTNLDAGDYVFRVRAANSDGIWNHQGLAIPIHVAPAPWETGWAYGGYAAAALLLLALAWRAHRRKLANETNYRRRLEAEVRSHTRQLEKQNRELEDLSEAKSQFLARMSHEIRTPMNGVLGMTELLLGTKLDQRQHRFTETIHQSAESLLEIINDILDYSKIEAGRLELDESEFDLKALVEDTVELLASSAQEKGLELICVIPMDLEARVCGDPLRLRQVLTNLIGNAIKFTKHGEVLVRLSVLQDAEPTIGLRFEVTDSGMGISIEKQAQIFDSFSQADGSTTRRYGGTGLGLAISRQLVELMGGKLTLQSTPGVGSCFRFTVALTRAKGIRRATRQRARLNGARALIVEQNQALREVLGEQIGAWGMEVTSTQTCDAAIAELHAAVERDQPYDVAVLASHLGGMAGARVARLIRAEPDLPHLKLLLLNTMASQLEPEVLEESAIDAQLTKPVRHSALHDALVQLMGDEERPIESPASTDDARPAPKPHARVLLVEDNPVNQAVAEGMLHELGYEVEVAPDGRAALEWLTEASFDLVLMDCQLPLMDGFEATTKIRERRDGQAHIPIIAVTANAVEGERERCLAAGMDDYLSKPFTLSELQAVLTEWLSSSPELTPRSGDTQEIAPLNGDGALIDQTALDNIRRLRGPGDADLLNQAIQLYLANSAELTRRLHEALERGDAEGVRQAAHALKSSSANLGAHTLAELCRDLEQSGRKEDLTDVDDTYHRLKTLYPRVITALQLETQKRPA